MSARKTAAAVANINTRVRLASLRTAPKKLDVLMDLIDNGHRIERETLELFRSTEFMRGFREGVQDANGEGEFDD